jgi:hypothetical protein
MFHHFNLSVVNHKYKSEKKFRIIGNSPLRLDAAFIGISLTFLLPLGLHAGADSPQPTDPYASTNYSSAFDTGILTEFSDVLKLEGLKFTPPPPSPPSCFSQGISWLGQCFKTRSTSSDISESESSFARLEDLESEALIEEKKEEIEPIEKERSALPVVSGTPDTIIESLPQITYLEYQARRGLMIKALLDQLHREKSRSAWRPTLNTGAGLASTLPVGAAGFGAARTLPPEQQALALWPLMEVIGKTGEVLRSAAAAVLYKVFPVNDPLLALEEEFVKKLPYVVEDERLDIVNEFGTVRIGLAMQGTEGRRVLKVRIGLVKSGELSEEDFARLYSHGHYVPKPPVVDLNERDRSPFKIDLKKLRPGQDLDAVYVRNFVKLFFEDYEQPKGAKKKIASELYGYVKKLRGHKTGTHTLLLQGSFGIGKSQFSMEVQKFLSQLLGRKFNFKTVSYTSREELLGSNSQPGILLTQMSAITERHGGFYFEEVNLNDLNEIAKLLFDSSGTPYSFPFFRGGGERSLEPYLSIVCSNETLKDEAIASRLAVVTFPIPKREAVDRKVKKILRETLKLAYDDQALDSIYDYFVAHDKIQELIANTRHFRLKKMVDEVIQGIEFERDEEDTLREQKELQQSLEAQLDQKEKIEDQSRALALSLHGVRLNGLRPKLRERLGDSFREEYLRNPMILGILNSDQFGEMSEAIQIELLIDTIQSPKFIEWFKNFDQKGAKTQLRSSKGHG